MQDFVSKVKNNEIDIVEHTHKVIEECKKINRDYNYFNVISDTLALEQAKNIIKNLKNKKLLGVFVSVKDNICVKGVESTAGSKILKGYKPLFNATAVQNAIDQGAIIIGKTAQDEFGFGTFSVNVGVDFKVPKNPFDKNRSTGGSSGGAAGITQKLSNHIALGESTGGSTAAPASFCGVFGLTPTYGLVSRYGLIDYANSLDKISTLGKTMEDASLLLDSISGYDEKDSTSLDVKNNPNKPVKRIGIIKEAFGKGVDKEIEKNVYNGISKLKENGIKTEEVSLKLPMKYGIEAYYLIAVAETSTNLSKLCGMRYGMHEKLEGNFNEYFTKVRSSNFGQEAKRRIILGTFARMVGYRDAFYMKAMKVRTLIIEEYKKLFKKYDALVSPTLPILPPKFSEIEKLSPLQNYMADIMTVSPNLAGLPHLSVPVGFSDKLPVGMLLTADHLQENKLVEIGKIYD